MTRNITKEQGHTQINLTPTTVSRIQEEHQNHLN